MSMLALLGLPLVWFIAVAWSGHRARRKDQPQRAKAGAEPQGEDPSTAMAKLAAQNELLKEAALTQTPLDSSQLDELEETWRERWRKLRPCSREDDELLREICRLHWQALAIRSGAASQEEWRPTPERRLRTIAEKLQ